MATHRRPTATNVNINTFPTQIPIGHNGSTLISLSTTQISMSDTQNFPTGRIFVLAPKASIPWAQGPLWAKSKANAVIVVLTGLYNIVT
jgi:hypothetical protein